MCRGPHLTNTAGQISFTTFCSLTRLEEIVLKQRQRRESRMNEIELGQVGLC